MIKFSDICTSGWDFAIAGMRNSYDSWEKSDSIWDGKDFKGEDIFVIGPNDMKLASRLAKRGGPHAKFRRMIHVQMNILAPLYFWKEWDTYKIGTTANSTSTMHSIMNKDFSIDDFSHEHLVENSEEFMQILIGMLNQWRNIYITELDVRDKKKVWWQIIQLLPSSYNQLRTVDLNYEVLAQMCEYRSEHKLDEWRDFCRIIHDHVPYAKQLIFCEKEAEDDKRCGSCETGSEEVESQRTDDGSGSGVSNE